MSTIDLSTIPAPDVVEVLDFESVVVEMKADLIARAPELEPVLQLESEPAVKILEVCAYRVLLMQARVNDAARAVMLATATGSDLDNLAAFYGVVRLVVTPADPDAVPPTSVEMETDARLRTRTQMALEGFSTAGPRGAYEFHAISASGQVRDVGITSPSPGEVVVSVLSVVGNGTAAEPLLETVRSALNAEDVRPLTDYVVVQSATIVNYQIAARIYCLDGPDQSVVMDRARVAADAYVASQHRIGRDVTLSGIYAALHQSGVQRVELETPSASITIAEGEAPFCTAINLTYGGIDE